MPSDVQPHDGWQDAARRAGFPFYEPDTSGERWADGYSADGSHIDIVAMVDGHETEVSTSRSQRGSKADSLQRRMAISQLLWTYLNEDQGELVLPYSVTVEADDRQVEFDSATQTVQGMRITGDEHWVGILDIDGHQVRIETTSRSTIPLRVCMDPESLPEHPPHAK